ncbi:DNA-(apurinic or apyrimidinic site) lyase 2 [Cytospora mali]|uniref:DNA-(apurinic or apyrimidinic site) endonuclease n=1 Tax=Cytospora mali TaxID=578113 RepID=A0A194UZK3_CYTMA|nr:DNA-(apurinic or apyrimidinic site) lyase 2 [Valsa mali var. pyri (nom. inval.)]
MGLRITTWNETLSDTHHGTRRGHIRQAISLNPNQIYMSDGFQAMFDTLEADIVIMQEAKIQRKDLTDDMVLVPGWDVFFSLPKDKKGKNSDTVVPIGGYPREDQIIGPVDEVILDSEGRAVILEFPAFVLIGVYVPATRDDTRTDFRMGFMSILDARIRNLVAMGKQVVLAGDLNIIRSDIDTAGCAEQLRKEGMTLDDFLSTPSRRFFNQLIFEGQVIGERDEGRGEPVMWDITRTFHPNRQGMFTCWETKKNARPGNFGSRIDYILCTAGLKEWFEDSNIQEGLMGSDHCPVYATMADCIRNGSKDVHIADLMNEEGMFKDGKRLREWSTRDMLPQSARLLTEFDRRRSIKDMFAKKLAAPMSRQASKDATESTADTDGSSAIPTSDVEPSPTASATPVSIEASSTTNLKSFKKTASPKATPKRSMPNIPSQPQKRMKTATSKDKVKPGPAQSTLKGFFRPKTTTSEPIESNLEAVPNDKTLSSPAKKGTGGTSPVDSAGDDGKEKAGRSASDGDETGDRLGTQDDTNVFDPIHSKESWSKLLGGKRVAPLCEHGQPCISYVVKKPGINCGRTFYMCSRPLGPSGQKEKNTQWRCATFIWARSAESKDPSTSYQSQ